MDNIKKIRLAVAEAGMDALLLTDPVSCLYATGFHFTDGAVLITGNGAFLITDSRYDEAACAAEAEAEVLRFTAEKKLTDILAELLHSAGAERIGVEEQRMSHHRWSIWSGLLPGKFVPADGLLTRLRGSKSPAELEKLIAAQRIAERAFDSILGLIRPGLTERELAAELVGLLLKNGADGLSFNPIVITGKKTSMPHGVPGNAVIANGDFVTMDFGCIKDGWCSDMTRTVAVGSADAEMRRVYDTVLAAQLAGIAAARPGVAGRDIHNAADRVIAGAGFGGYFGHGFGHSLGLEIHEAPSASPGNDRPMPEGAVISAEPGIYIPGKFGVRIEDVLYLTGNTSVNITKAPKNLIIL